MRQRHQSNPNVVVLAGPNGAGKSTAAPQLLRRTLSVRYFVNADTIARGLSAFEPERVAMTAGRIMLDRLRQLANDGESFAFETTLASRSFAPWLRELIDRGYNFRLVFLWLPSDDVAVARVRSRVKSGGHDVPEETIRRRYRAGLQSFFELYQPIALSWRIYDNSKRSLRLVAYGSKKRGPIVLEPALWKAIRKVASS